MITLTETKKNTKASISFPICLWTKNEQRESGGAIKGFLFFFAKTYIRYRTEYKD